MNKMNKINLNNILYSYDYIPYNITNNNKNKNYSIDKIIIIINLNNSNNNQINVLNNLILLLKKRQINNITIIHDSNQLDQLHLSNNSIIYFLPTLEKLDLNNFKSCTLQYCNINKFLLNNNLNCKCIIFSTLTKIECNHYLNSSILGSMRYFLEFNQLQLYFIDFDLISLNNSSNIQLINDIIFNNQKEKENLIQREFIFRNNKLLIEIIKNNSNFLSSPLNGLIESPNIYNDCGKTILVTGQTGTILNIIYWLVNKKSKDINSIIILTVSDLKQDLNNLIQNHYHNENIIKFYFKKVDISNLDSLELAINQLYFDNKELPKPDTIIHFAFIKAEYNYNDISIDNLNKSLSVKAMGSILYFRITIHLLSIKYNWPIKNFINGSSTCSLLGLKDECGYVSASLILDSLIRYRNSIFGNICGYSINWGSISRDKNISKVFLNQGQLEVSNDLIFYIFDLILFNNSTNDDLNNSNFIVSNFNINVFKKIIQNSNYNYLFNNLLLNYKEKDYDNK